jgi:hypothetical protein
MDLAGSLIAAPQACFDDDPILKDAWWTQMVYHGSLKGVGNSRTQNMSLFALIRQAEILSFFLCQTVIALVLVLVEWLPWMQ